MKYNFVTIEREYASGGTEIGERLAGELHIPCYGKEILEVVARENGTTPKQIQDLEESANGSLLYSIAMAAQIITGESSGLSQENALYLAEARTIYDYAHMGNCIIVGRCANWVLKDRKDVLNVFIHADTECRKQRAVGQYHENPARIENLLKKYDKRRSNYYIANTGKKWDDKMGYHLVLDSGKLGIGKCVEIIKAAML